MREEGGGAEGKSLGKDGDIYDAESRKRYTVRGGKGCVAKTQEIHVEIYRL